MPTAEQHKTTYSPVQADISQIESELSEAKQEMTGYLKELGYART
ncbi:hypothetical protein [Methylotuvimicrobium alcaliphilum]|uniref:Uncharacterized protein n=1 Tax=Methylotuvimicrobium alcaliphilum (strain DSM 19304 / NCIMB 14124 / VKM B-2133 / 20Z) TaxID=1091494 RepID=G4T425_META2|nr:hypothetical protein [Methylotuvimicrobium alcaliphilum]CCE23760.1 protein of unknown function [Methylotuvimicrobium alcaliphilum 20Z]